METSIVGVGVSVSDRFRGVVDEKVLRIEHLAPRAQRLDIKVTHRAYHNGRVEDETVELTLTGKGPIVRAEAVDRDKFVALDLAVDKLCEQLRRAKDKRVDARKHPRGARLDKETGSISGVDVQPASAEALFESKVQSAPIIAQTLPGLCGSRMLTAACGSTWGWPDSGRSIRAAACRPGSKTVTSRSMA